MSSTKINLLLTGAGTQTFANVFYALKKQKEIGVRIVACDIDPLAYGLYLADQKYLIPKASDSSFIPKILKICQKEKINILIPLLSLEFPYFSQNKDQFAKIGIKLPISNYETVKICMDKKLTYDFFKENRIPTPKTYLPEELPQKLDFPLLIKPRHLSGTKFVQVVKNRKELNKCLEFTPYPLIQEFIRGEEYTIDILSDWNSNPIALVPRIRLKTLDGKSVSGKTIDDQKLISYAKKIVNWLKLIGPANIQCFKVKRQYFFTEINPRFSAGGLPLTIEAGVNIPLLLIKMVLGESLKGPLPYKKNFYMLRYFTEIVLDKKNLIKKHL